MAWPATMAARVTVLLVMVPLAPATMVALVTALLVTVSLAPALALLTAAPVHVPADTRARRSECQQERRMEQLKTRRRHEASGLVRG